MKSRVVAWSVAVLLVVGCFASAEAVGPLSKVAQLSLGTRAHDLIVDGSLAYVATDLGLTIVNIANPAAPVVVGSVNVGGRALGIAFKSPYVYLAAQAADLKVINVTNPSAPVVVASKVIAGYAWDVAVKDDVVYVGTFSGQLYLFSISNPAIPVQIDILGLPAWTTASQDATNITKLKNSVSSGSAKVAGVSVAGNSLFAVDWNYGRVYHFDATAAATPIFRGTHYAPYLFRIEGDPAGDAVYSLSAFGSMSGIYSIRLSTMDEAGEANVSTRHNTCGLDCDYFKSPNTDYGGLVVTPSGNHVVYIAGKIGEVRVLDVTNPFDIVSVASIPTGPHSMRTGESMGVQVLGDHIFAAAGLLGLQVYDCPGLSQ